MACAGAAAGQIMIPVAAILVVVGEILGRRLTAAMDAALPPPEEVVAAVAKLMASPLAKAEQRARAELASGEAIPHITVADGEPPALVAEMAPGLRAFFAQWSEVAIDESTWLSWEAIGPSERRPGRLRIGDSGEDNGEYLVLPGEEAVLYVEQPYVAGSPEVEQTWPSVWHVVCFMAGCLEEIALKAEAKDGQF